MSCPAIQEDFRGPFMSDSPSRDEVEKMIKDAIRTGVKGGVQDGLDAWMKQYGLKPHHWVYLDAEYSRSVYRRSVVAKVLITSIVTAVCIATLWTAEEWIKKIVVEHYKESDIEKLN